MRQRSFLQTFHAVLPLWMNATVGRAPRSMRSERDPPPLRAWLIFSWRAARNAALILT
jgi:hypothetical protein